MIIFYFNQLFQNYVLKYFYKLSERLKCHYRDEINIIYNNSENLNENYFNNNENYVILIFEREVPEFIYNKPNIKTILIWDDCHLLMNKNQKIRDDYYNFINKHDIFICTYGYLYLNDPNIKSKIYSINHCFIPEFIPINNNPEKLNKINIVGTINESYDLRKFIYDNYFNNPYLNFYNTNYVIQNNNFIIGNSLIDNEWYNYINSFKVNFTDTGINDEYKDRKYIVSKFFEIGSLNTLLLCDDRVIEEISLLGLEEDIHYISCNKNNFIEKVNYILNYLSEDKYNNIINNCKNVIHKYHCINNRVIQFSDIIDDRYYMINIKDLFFYIELLNRNDSLYNVNYVLVNFIIDNLLVKKNHHIQENIFIDINADLGLYSLLLSKYYNKIYTFDTNVLKIRKIQNSLSKNKFTNIKLIRKNISNIIDHFYEDDYNICRRIKLDTFIQNNNITKIYLLKISIYDLNKNIELLESMEYSIIDNIIENILFEVIIVDSNIDKYKSLIEYIYNFFIKYNYYIYFINNNNNKIIIEYDKIYNILNNISKNNYINIYVEINIFNKNI